MYKQIEEFPNYSISEEGRVINTKYNREITQYLNNQGYFEVNLWKNGIGKNRSIHRLVALAFIPNLENKKEVNHKNSDRRNNSIDNLEWTSRKENNDCKLNKKGKGRISKKLIMKIYKQKEWKNADELVHALMSV